MLEYKTVSIADLKVGIDGPGSFAGYASVFNQIDSYGDTIVPGAYAETIPKFLKEGFIGWSHDAHGLPAGYPTVAHEDKKGLWLEGSFHSTPEAQLARVTAAERVAAGKTMGLSIGFIPEEFEFADEGAIRRLKKIELLETSLVLLPADRHALVEDVKHEERATWTTAYVNNLPDSAFAVILPGGSKDSDGKTTPRSLRKLPHHDASGKVDVPHLRNALSREPQTDMPESAHSTASAHLARHAKAEGLGGGKDASALFDIDVPFEELALQLKGWSEYFADEAEALRDRRAAEQRKLSDAHVEAISSVVCAAGAVSERLEGLLATVPPPASGSGKTDRIRFDVLRRQLTARGVLEKN